MGTLLARIQTAEHKFNALEDFLFDTIPEQDDPFEKFRLENRQRELRFLHKNLRHAKAEVATS